MSLSSVWQFAKQYFCDAINVNKIKKMISLSTYLMENFQTQVPFPKHKKLDATYCASFLYIVQDGPSMSVRVSVFLRCMLIL